MSTQNIKTAQPDQTPPEKLPKTTGEKWFDIVRFGAGEVFILFFTAVLAYYAKFGGKLGNFPNPLKAIQNGAERFLGNMFGKNPFTGAFASTLVTFWGGNFFAPVMKWMHDRKETIVTYFNKHFGKEGEVETGQKQLKNEPRQTWGDVIKGRLAAFAVVFTSFVGTDIALDAALGKDKVTGERWFNVFEDKFARFLASFTKEGKEIAKIPFNPVLETNRTYRFGRILAIDIFATTASLAIWTLISRLSAALRSKNVETELESADPIIGTGVNFQGKHKQRHDDITSEKEEAPIKPRASSFEKEPDFRSRVQNAAELQPGMNV